jgi:hypothetical protein
METEASYSVQTALVMGMHVSAHASTSTSASRGRGTVLVSSKLECDSSSSMASQRIWMPSADSRHAVRRDRLKGSRRRT